MNTIFGFIKRKIRHPSAPDSGLTHHAGMTFNPGAESFAVSSEFQNPAFGLLGPGFACGSLRPLQPPQIYVNPSIPTRGLGGLQTGQFVTIPLVNDDLSAVE